jgi:hypothetical protein
VLGVRTKPTIYGCQDPGFHRAGGNWKILHWQHNHSAFSGYRETNSDYSEIVCLECHRTWRTKAEYVNTLSHITDAEKKEWLEGR